MKGLAQSTVIVTTLVSAGAVFLLCRMQGSLAFGTAALIVALASMYFRSRIGGITGDCFGATFQFVEVITYAVFLA
jgi:adenosylcobinamide-GDP ribazoletransferase